MTDWASIEAYGTTERWRPLLVPSRYGYGYSYPDDFDREAEYEFRRSGSDTVERFRLANCSPYFNVAGLEWRAPSSKRK